MVTLSLQDGCENVTSAIPDPNTLQSLCIGITDILLYHQTPELSHERLLLLELVHNKMVAETSCSTLLTEPSSARERLL